ncbi:MAG: hypothetical protein V4494_06285 [Chlamydiota bacterium]
MAVHFPKDKELNIIDNNQQIIIQPVHYSYLERIFRTAVFRFAVKDSGLLEKALIYSYKVCSERTLFPTTFNEVRAEKSLDILRALGAKEHFVKPDDGQANVHMLTLKAQDFEDILNSYGATWEHIEVPSKQGMQSVLAIVLPDASRWDDAWENYEQNCLLKMGWVKDIVNVRGKEREVIITCDTAGPILPSQWHEHCFLYTHSTSGPFSRDRARAGFYLGMKQDLCFFDNRGIGKSKGIPTEAGFYADIDAVYKKLMETTAYDPKQLWLSGYCGGGPVAAYLKAKLHKRGINFIEEQSFSNFRRDFINKQHSIAKQFALHHMRALSSKNAIEGVTPEECDFNVETLWKNLDYYEEPAGKVVLIHATNDQKLSDVSKDIYEDVARKVNKSVTRIHFTSAPSRDAHSDDFFRYGDARQEFINAVFR